MNALYNILTVLMFLDCFVLVLFVLAQLPKKEAGAGMAFGGGATDALFGAGSGNFMTNITKYAAGIFFGLALIMAMVASHAHSASGANALKEELMKQTSTSSEAPASFPATAPSANNGLLQAPLLSNVPPATTKSTAPGTNK